MTETRSRTLAVFAVLLLGILIYSGIDPFDRMTWALEVFPAAAALVLMVVTYRRFPLTTLLYACIFVHCLVLILGGVYTYARVPLGFQIADLFHLTRNPYDKIGHFFQGFVPALVAREILIRGAFVNGRRMLNFLIACVVLAISAFYELIEWWVALLAGQGADEAKRALASVSDELDKLRQQLLSQDKLKIEVVIEAAKAGIEKLKALTEAQQLVAKIQADTKEAQA